MVLRLTQEVVPLLRRAMYDEMREAIEVMSDVTEDAEPWERGDRLFPARKRFDSATAVLDRIGWEPESPEVGQVEADEDFIRKALARRLVAERELLRDDEKEQEPDIDEQRGRVDAIAGWLGG